MTETPDSQTDRSPGLSVQAVYDGDKHGPPPVLREVSTFDQGTDDIDRLRYVSQEWHDLEVERLWKRVWQMACREEDIPEVGDSIVYDIADSSLIIVRSAPDELRAFHNSCLHRGTTLRVNDGWTPEFRCPFHGFTWSLQGELTAVPCSWDFPHVDFADYALPEAQVNTWNGWVFVNMDLGALPLADHLGAFVEKFPWDQADTVYKRVHVAKVLRCNWKVALEAFIESHHVVATHPQLLTMTGDANTQYDVWEDADTWSRMITLQGVPSPHLPTQLSEQEVMDSMLSQFMGEGVQFPIPEGETARGMLAELTRSQMRPYLGDDADVSDSEALDSIEYHVFPNFVPWGGFTRINYRFRPYGNDPHQCVMDVMLLAPVNPSMPRPKPGEVQWLGPDDSWSTTEGLGALANVFNQDTSNLPRVQRGLRASVKDGVVLGKYQESRIRHYHAELSRWISGERGDSQ
ncbi:MAG TPA: aromatic ring-hydroxylating dioxygenase subunit alpha [Acidimicrobiales bacterium]